MAQRMSSTGKKILSLATVLGIAAATMIAFGGLGVRAQAPAGAPGAPPPAPMQYDPATWIGCHHVTNGPGGQSGAVCAPSIRTGTPEIQARLQAEAAARGPGAGRGAGGAPQGPALAIPMPCGPNPDAPAPAAAPAGGRGPARPNQGGHGPIRVLVVTKGHEFEREAFFNMLDCLGDDITYAHADHPAADLLMNPVSGKNFDVYLFYDLGGPGQRSTNPDGTRSTFYPDPSPQLKKDFEALTKAGKGMVFIHHASAAWPHVWPEYSEVIGGACDWYAPVTVRGILDPHHGFYGGTKQHLTVVDKNGPITKGLGDGFDVTDEAYACAWFPESVHPLLTTSFAPPDPRVNLNPARQYSNYAAWYKASENSPVFYTQVGHDHSPWQVAEYQLLIRNAIKWAASKEALDWARKNHTTIFK